MNDADAIDLALLVLRCCAGVVMLAHGYNHIFGGGKIAGTARWFGSMGMRQPRAQAWLASLTELGAGALLILGLLTPLAAAGVVGVMTVAWAINHRGNGFFIFRPGEGWEYVMTLAVVGLAVGTVGPGRWSIDHAADLIEDLTGWSGLLITTLAGLGGAALLLAAFWRPSPPTEPAR
jgi:putative oxidoreductase